MIGDILLPVSYDWFVLISRIALAAILLLFLWRVMIVISRDSLRFAPSATSHSLILLDELDRPLRGFRLSRRRPVTIGRDAANDIVLGDRSVSGHHAVVRLIGSEWVISDLDSRNGTLVNGDAIAAESSILPNDVVQFGAVRLRLVTDESR